MTPRHHPSADGYKALNITAMILVKPCDLVIFLGKSGQVVAEKDFSEWTQKC